MLQEYRKKRTFDKTPEPKGGKAKGKQLIFVVQKHDATRLHYDFRLEMEGVLKSWAIPKGPSLNPADKRLAMMVEDHPYDYRDFEGIIPEGNYGAGTVIVWDTGTYEPLETAGAKTKTSAEKTLLKELKAGSLKFRLHGEKLKGEFALVHIHGREENAWLLIKHKDEFAAKTDITKKDKSIVTGRNLQQVEKDKNSATWTSNKAGKAKSEKADQPAKRKTKEPPVTLTNLKKLYWKKEKITKGDTIEYYRSVAEYILPYIKDRPQSMNRFPDGIDGPHFYNKNVSGSAPEWIKTLEYAAGEDGKLTNYLVASGESSLLYMVNLGCIEINPWHSRARTPEKPDWCVIDLDPDKTNTFAQVMQVANITHDVLESLGVPSYCKTSGSTGIHIYIPLGAKYSYDQSRLLAQLVVTSVQQEIPDITSLERSPAKRKGKIYLDFLQNRPTQTIAAPYSLRPKPGAPVSMPLHWEELKPKLAITDFNIYNALDRIRDMGDIFSPVLDKGIDLKKVLQSIKD